ncbi:MAG: glycine cleavage system protein R [Verrucomicrobia bacterium]|nr:MAG: glycine cleavage system protein R [Verrucomicrobiota bacterium]
MKCHVVLTLLGDDQPGLVHAMADLVTNHGGNWLESRMANMAGQFAGLARIECEEQTVGELMHSLRESLPSMTFFHHQTLALQHDDLKEYQLEVLGLDRKGIVREMTAAIARAGGNIESLETRLESAPMTGQWMFRAQVILSVPEAISPSAVRMAIESLGGDLTVEMD